MMAGRGGLKSAFVPARGRSFDATPANQTGLTNGRAANWAPEVVFSPFRALSRRQLTLPFYCKIILMFRWEDSLVSCVDGSPDERVIRVKTLYKCCFKNIRIYVDGAFHDSVNLQIWPESFCFFISFIINSVNSGALICIRKPNSVGF